MNFEFAIFDSRFELQAQLLRVQFVERIKRWGRLQQRVGAQQHRSVGEEANDPRQLQAVEKDLAQPQLVFLVRLSGFDPGSHLLEQLLRGRRVHRQESQQRLMGCGRKPKLARTSGSFPTHGAAAGLFRYTKPLELVVGLIPQPLQGLALPTAHLRWGFERRDQVHILFEPRDDGGLPTLPHGSLGGRINVAHVTNDEIRAPLPTAPAMRHTGAEQTAFAQIGWGRPTDQRHQQHPTLVAPQPQAEGVLLVADKETALACLERASAQGRSLGTVLASPLFLKPQVAAGKSVASIRATEKAPSAAAGSSGIKRCSLIRRNPATPSRCRNSCSTHGSGSSYRLGRWAKRRQARCSASIRTSRLNECTGVSSTNKCTRQSWAVLKSRRRPRPRSCGNSRLIHRSGMCAENASSNACVPVGGSNDFMAVTATLKKRMRPLHLSLPHFSCATSINSDTYSDLSHTL